MLKGEEITYIINNAGPKAFLFEDSLLEEVLAIRSELAEGMSLGWIDFGKAPKLEKCFDASSLYSNQYTDTEPEVMIESNDQCMMMYTSGTESLPKGVISILQNPAVILLIWKRSLRHGLHDAVIVINFLKIPSNPTQSDRSYGEFIPDYDSSVLRTKSLPAVVYTLESRGPRYIRSAAVFTDRFVTHCYNYSRARNGGSRKSFRKPFQNFGSGEVTARRFGGAYSQRQQIK